MITCWVPSDRGHDLRAAEDFGQVRFICTAQPNVFAERTLARLVAHCVAQSSAEDFLVPTGSMPVVALFAAAFLLRHGRLNILIYDNRTENYVPWSVTDQQLTAALVD